MRIAIVTHKIIKGDGQGRVNYEIAKAAVHRGHRVFLLATEVAHGLASEVAVRWVPISIAGWPTTLLQNQIFAWRSARWIYGHSDELDLIIANGFITWAPADINAVHFVHSAWRHSRFHIARLRKGPYAWYQWLYSALNAYWERRAFRQSQLIVAVSEQVRADLTGIGIPYERIQVVHNGVDVEEFKPGHADRRSLGLPEDVRLALFVGDIRTPRKNLDTVLRALKYVPELHLAVVGSTYRSPYPQMAQNLGVSARTHFLGFRADVPDVMRAADLFVFPSRYEACSLVLLEAMAAGLPIVTARTAGGAELITTSCGIVLPDPDDEENLIEILQTLIQNPTKLQRMGYASRSVAEHYTWADMARRYMDLIEKESHVPTIQ